MSRLFLVVMLPLAVAISGGGFAAAGEFKIGEHKFTLPDGFEIEQIAGPGLVDRPITADFDDEGRLYVSDSSGSNDKVEKQLEEKPHRIVRLEDTDGAGRFDKSVVFAERMMFPEGTMWLEGSLYVAAPPSIWKLTDTDGDGRADVREEWFQGKTLTGCANDLHGPYAGPDGWIYWCKGAFARQTYERDGKEPFTTRAAHIFRCRPDGSGIEAVMTGGMDNPVDVVFMPNGERIFTTTFLQHPGGGKRDGLLHDVYGGVYGKVWEPIDEHPRTGDVLPVLSHFGAAAPCGLTRYESQVFGDDYRDNLFACLFNMHKVTRHVLTPDGATFKSADSDFLVSDNLDFHPTDVLEDADGSLVVLNTGGWYKLCCPTSQLHKPDVLGAIYRVRKTGTKKVDDPRGTKIAWATMSPEKLAPLLNDGRPVVRRRAIRELAGRSYAAIEVLRRVLDSVRVKGGGPEEWRESPSMRQSALWALTRMDNPAGRELVRRGLLDPDEAVRVTAACSISLWRDREGLKALAQRSGGPQLRRIAAEAFGRIGDRSVVPQLFDWGKELDRAPDRMLEHSIIFALIEIADAAQTSERLNAPSPAVRRVALIALDQMPGGGLDPAMVAGLLGSKEPVIKETAAWIVGRHPEWGDALAGYLRTRLAAKDLNDAEASELQRLLAQFARSAEIRQLMAQALDEAKLPPRARRAVLRAMAGSNLKEPPANWIAALPGALAVKDIDLLEPAVAAAGALPSPKAPDPELVAALLEIAGRADVPANVRIGALAAVPGGLLDVSPQFFEFLRVNLDPEREVLVRSGAAGVLARAALTPEQLAALTESFKVTGPLEADRLLPAYKASDDEEVGLKLIAALKESPALSGLRIDSLKANLAKFPESVQTQAEELYGLINVDAAKQKERLDALLSSLKEGDIRRGQAVFNSTKAACAACHPFGYLGGNVGPDLTSIGKIRSERDLLEAIVFPSVSFVRSFEPVVILTRDGKSVNGLVKRESAEEIVLATGPREEARIARNEIEELRQSSVSVMPSGLDQQLSPQDLADLVAFLKNAK